MKKIIIILTIFIATSKVFAQDIVVIDMETSFPIEHVRVKSENGKYLFYTNSEGIVNVRNFRRRDKIIFEHPNYETYTITKRDIIKNKYTVEMIKNYQKLDNIILSVSRTKNKKNSIAEQVVVIDKIESQKIIPSTTADLLNTSGNIAVQKTQGGAGSPIIRGLEANRILLVIDGVRLNNAISRTGHLHSSISINPLVLERSEIIYGPSAIYGSDALGGVINFYTQTPIINHYKKIKSSLTGRYSSASNETTFGFNTDISFRKWASSFAFTYSDFGDVRMGKVRNHGYKKWGIANEYSQNSNLYYSATATENTNKNVQPKTGYNQNDFFNKTIFDLGNQNELIINTQFNINSKIHRFDKLMQRKSGNLKYAEWYYGPATRFLISPQLSLNFDKKWLKKAKIILSYQDLKESRIFRKFTSLDRSHQNENIKVYGLNADFNTYFSRKKLLSYGLEATYNSVNSKAYSETLILDGNKIINTIDGPPVPTRYPDGGSYYSSLAAYGNFRFDIGKKSKINTGIRFTQTYIHVKWIDNTFITLPYNINELANYAFTGNLSYIFAPKNWKMNILLSSGFRSPNIDDIGKIREKKGKVTVPNIFLKPEYAYTGEYSIAKFFNNKRFSISANAYYTLLYNYIARDKFEVQPGITQILYNGEYVDTYANQNSGNAEIYGGSLVLDGKLTKHIKLNGGIFYTKGQMIDAKRPMPSIPPIYGNTKLTYKFENIETALLYKFMLKKPITEYDVISGIDNLDETPFNTITSEYEGFPQWHIFNLYAAYHFNKQFTLNIAVENIFNIHYKEFASAISAPGRNFKIQLTTRL